MTDKRQNAQDNISSRLTAGALIEFQHEFRNVYPEHVMRDAFTAVGPMQTFLGFLVETGRIVVTDGEPREWQTRVK